MKSTACPCGSGKNFATCCAPYLEGQPTPNAESLMRSRYTAFTLQKEDYLLSSWHPATRPERLDLHADPQPKWLGLDVKQHRQQDATHATVTFVARYRIEGRGQRLSETSRFVLEEGRWYYVDGDVTPQE